MSRGPLPLREVLKISSQIAQALEYAHTHEPPVVHRDIKPSNILIEECSGRAVVTDFGIAKVLGAPDRTRTGTMLGTLRYCAPEQILQGKSVDGRADIYALGLVMYEMAAGCRFFAETDQGALLGRVLHGPGENIPTFLRSILPEFVALVTRCIAREREHRYLRASELLQSIKGCLALLELQAAPTIPMADIVGEKGLPSDRQSRSSAGGESRSAALRQPHSITPQILGVSHRQDAKGNEELVYAPAPLGMETVVPSPAFVPIRWHILQKDIEAIRMCVEDLTRRALVGQKRGDIGIEPVARVLARHVLPAEGFVGMMGANIHPQFDIIQDVASEIPWEVLEERYFSCPECDHFTSPHRPLESGQPYCEKHGIKMETAGGKLVLRCHLTHLVRGHGRPGGEGRAFLFVEDPTGDLCSATNDPKELCKRHLALLRNMLEKHGYTINPCQNRNATINRVLNALSDPSVVGVYYFGHGFFPRDGNEGCLMLADGRLFASQIEEVAPTARFVFLNACEGAATGRDWDLDKRSRSVAEALAKGGPGKVVIAPLWPVVNVQAAETALDFFQNALTSVPLAEALRSARQNSLEQYEAGEPHISWMAYRYFGDPNKTLPKPVELPIEVGHDAVATAGSRVFDESGQLNMGVFAFAVDEVLLRAAKRRNLQGRTHVTISDFFAGMIRKGDLTRFELRKQGTDPDELYEVVGKEKEAEPGGTDNNAEVAVTGGLDLENLSEAKLRELRSKWVVRNKEEFSDGLIKLLDNADRLAQQRTVRTEDRRISEHDMLESLITDETWSILAPIRLPPVSEMRRQLQEREKSEQIDENGAISLTSLDADARRIIETAHTLAQQRGVFPIANRLLLAAFLVEAKGHAARVCQCVGIKPKLLFVLMIAVTEERPPRSFGLSPEACERIVIPVIEEAMRIASGDRLITESDLFKAFCEKAGPGLKEWLRLLPLEVDLDKLKSIDPDVEELLEGVSPDGRRIIETAHALAQERGVRPIPNRLLLAAFLADPCGYTAELFKSHHIPAQSLRAKLIAAVGGGSASSFPLNRAACERAVVPTLQQARELAAGTDLVTEQVLFKAFCAVAPLALKRMLRSVDQSIDMDALGSEGDLPQSAEEIEGRESIHPGSDTKSASPLSSSASGADSGEASREDEHAETFRPEQFEDRAWRVLMGSAQLARLQGWTEVRTPHLFAALIGDGSGPVGDALRRNNVNPEEIKKIVLSLVPPQALPPGPPPTPSLGRNASMVVKKAVQHAVSQGRTRVTEKDLLVAFFADGGGVVSELLHRSGMKVPLAGGGKGSVRHRLNAGSSVLSALGMDLTEKARCGQLPEIVGRDNEIETSVQTLLLSENANPLLVGEAGVGKTAIVEGIAQQIAQGRCPKKLQSMHIIELSAGRLLANTRLRGEFEERIQEVLAEAREDVILFIDEIHTIVGAGSAEGYGPDAGNMLKAALARGEIKLIGATTYDEYKRTIARDKALSRRFQIQMIRTPSREAAIDMLSARQRTLEQYHDVYIDEETKAAAVDLSGRFIVDKQWPAKARDVLERACILAVTETETSPTAGKVAVTLEHVAKVISRQTGIPFERVSASDRTALATLEERVSKRIIGQKLAVKTVADAIGRGGQDFVDADRPRGVFLFVGPPGVGKTELAKVLAEEVYGGPDGLIRFDMGDFTEPHSAAKLLGAPPGYVGYEQGAPLVEQLRKRPYSLLLFDEIEHAHENVLAVLLRLLSEGTLIDSDGDLADARNSIVILTSNALDPDREGTRVGFIQDRRDGAPQLTQTQLRASLERHLPPKLIDRVDAITCFNPLAGSDLQELAGKTVSEVVNRVASVHAVPIYVSPDVLPWLAQKAASESSGARAIQRIIDEHFSNVLMKALSNVSVTETVCLELLLKPDKSSIVCNKNETRIKAH